MLPPQVLRPFTTVGEAANGLNGSVRETGHTKIHFVPVPGGVALIATAPSIDGTLGQTGPTVLRASNPVLAILESWFGGNPGRHTALMLMITDEAWSPGAARFYRALDDWGSDGYVSVPPQLHSDSISPRHQPIAALYVFQQKEFDGELVLVETGYSVTGYLRETGLWDRLGLR